MKLRLIKLRMYWRGCTPNSKLLARAARYLK